MRLVAVGFFSAFTVYWTATAAVTAYGVDRALFLGIGVCNAIATFYWIERKAK